MSSIHLFVLFCMVCCADAAGHPPAVRIVGKEDTMRTPDDEDGAVVPARDVSITVISVTQAS
jgi:hypothetical protein